MKISPRFPNLLHFSMMIKGAIYLKHVLAEHSWEIPDKKTSRDSTKIRLFLSLFQKPKRQFYRFSISAAETSSKSNAHQN